MNLIRRIEENPGRPDADLNMNPIVAGILCILCAVLDDLDVFIVDNQSLSTGLSILKSLL